MMPRKSCKQLQAELEALRVEFDAVDQKLVDKVLAAAKSETEAPLWLESREGQVAARLALGLKRSGPDADATGPEPDHLLNVIVFLAGRKYEALLAQARGGLLHIDQAVAGCHPKVFTERRQEDALAVVGRA